MSEAGFSIFEHVLSADECDLMVRVLDSVVHRQRAGARNLMAHSAISNLAHDDRLLQIANITLDAEANPFRATLFDKSAASNWHVSWHQDRALPISERVSAAGWGPWSTKSGVLYGLAPARVLNRVVALRIHLDASTKDNGPLRVIPASHKAGVLSSADILRETRTVAAETCLVGRGGVLAMRPLLLHSSIKATDNRPRRVIHIEYVTHLEADGVRLCIA